MIQSASRRRLSKGALELTGMGGPFLFKKFNSAVIDRGQSDIPNYNGGVGVYTRDESSLSSDPPTDKEAYNSAADSGQEQSEDEIMRRFLRRSVVHSIVAVSQ